MLDESTVHMLSCSCERSGKNDCECITQAWCCVDGYSWAQMVKRVLDTISVSYYAYDPPRYVLLFRNGNVGWYRESRTFEDSRKRKNIITPITFNSWCLFPCKNKLSYLLQSCRLIKQYAIDPFSRAEAQKLPCFWKHQGQLQAPAQGRVRELLGESGSMEDDGSVILAGRLFILPLTNVGGERYMHEQMHYITASSNSIFHPDFFDTITCNPNWQEIRTALLPGEITQDTPSLAVGLFMMKYPAMMSIVTDKKLFGSPAASLLIIYFQNCRPFNVHWSFFHGEASKQRLKHPENADCFVCAGIPSIQLKMNNVDL